MLHPNCYALIRDANYLGSPGVAAAIFSCSRECTMRIATLFITAFVLTSLCHFAWFARPIEEAELAQAEASEAAVITPVAVHVETD